MKFFDKNLIILQPEKGYRFSVDAVILACHANPSQNQRVLDIGAGCGIISLLLAYQFTTIKIYAVEIQQSMAYFAYSNVLKNQLSDRIKIICKDLKVLSQEDIDGSVDMVVVNPPYEKLGCARIGPDSAKNAATHEIFTTLYDVIDCSERMLKKSGTLVMIYPAQRLVELMSLLRKAKLEPKWLRMVHPHVLANANRVIVKSVKNGGEGLCIESPLYLHRANGAYTPEVQNMFL